MNKTKAVIWIIPVIALLILSGVLYKKLLNNNAEQTALMPEQTLNDNDSFSSLIFHDGLKNPDSVTTYQLDEFDVGISEKSVFFVDINNDGIPDRITKVFFDNGNAHSYYKYTVELKDDEKYVDITPNKLQTTNGADCDLQQIQFKFKPQFQIIVISREMGDTWDDPTMAYKQIFTLKNNKIYSSQKIKLREICDVKELF